MSGPGYRRMMQNLGPQRAEELRRDTVEKQHAARRAAIQSMIDRDRRIGRREAKMIHAILAPRKGEQ